MKKLGKWMLCLAVVLGAAGCGKKEENADGLKFKQEYEALNGKESSSGKEYAILSIPADNPMTYASEEEVIDLLEEGTGIIYFGFPECPWCRSALPELLQAAENRQITKIWYCNNLDHRDTRSLDEQGNVVVEKEGTEEYYRILELLGDHASVYAGLNDESIKRLYFPTVVAVVDGEVQDVHAGTLDSVEDPYVPLTEEQAEELTSRYEELMEKVSSCGLGEGC